MTDEMIEHFLSLNPIEQADWVMVHVKGQHPESLGVYGWLGRLWTGPLNSIK